MPHWITPKPITAESFAPYGHVFETPPLGASGLDVIEELRNDRAQARLRLTFASVAATDLPLEARMMERHSVSTQVFVPLDCAGYLVAVAPKAADGGPDLARIEAFRVPGTVAIGYAPDVWHHPITVLGRDARFAILTFVDGTAADQDIVPLQPGVVFSA